MTWTLSHGWSGTLTRQAIIDKVGPEMAEELSILYPEENPVEIPDGIDINHLQVDEKFEAAKGPFLGKDMEGGGRGSNAWAVSPEKSNTGRPVLCNDTHLVLNTPGIWYLNHYILRMVFIVWDLPFLVFREYCWGIMKILPGELPWLLPMWKIFSLKK